MPQSPAPGWYTDPQGLHSYRWWDGDVWTAHTMNAPVPAPSPAPVGQATYGTAAMQSGFSDRPVMAAPARPTQFRPAAPVSGWERNRYAFITMGIVVIYALLAFKAHVYILGILPVMMSARSKQRHEPLAIVAILAAVVAVLIAISGFTSH